MILTLWIALYAAVFVVVRQGQERGGARPSEEGCDTCFPCCGAEEDEVEEEQEVQQNEQEFGAATGTFTWVPDSLSEQDLTRMVLGADVQGAHHHHHGYDGHHSHHDGGYHHYADDSSHHF